MSHFTLAEFSASDTATRLQIDNTLPDHLVPAAEQTLLMLERIRQHLSAVAGRDIPVRISSGYRCLALNWALKSASTSDHVAAAAADWTAPSFGTPYQICLVLLRHQAALGIGQLIHEHGRWVHTSTKPATAINAAITITHAGVQAGIQEA
jgi:hypothetical protein